MGASRGFNGQLERGRKKNLENQKANRTRPEGAGDSRFAFRFHVSFATSPGCVKGAVLLIIASILAGLPPGSPMFDYPIRQGSFEPDIVTGFFRLNPFVP
jgi:hypothetical protein